MSTALHPHNPVVNSDRLHRYPGWEIREYADGQFDAASLRGPALSPMVDSFNEALAWVKAQRPTPPRRGPERDLRSEPIAATLSWQRLDDGSTWGLKECGDYNTCGRLSGRVVQVRKADGTYSIARVGHLVTTWNGRRAAVYTVAR